MSAFTLSREQTALLVIDMQERMFAAVDRGQEVLQTILKTIKGFHLLHRPIYVSEQYPQGLGPTIDSVQQALGGSYQPLVKTTFSCMDEEEVAQFLLSLPIQQWVLVGIEAHVCVLQTAKGLINAGRQVVVLNDAMTSRSIYDFSTAIAEMRDGGIRISCVETVLFELLKDSKAPEFKQISQLVKTRCSCPCSG